ncbi:MAG: FGGY-family carbohydrate kinase [Oscillospiraceae bacterium]|nr:FGGY-family carbohydrate kinase [Oscillospiraceae bacterium]
MPRYLLAHDVGTSADKATLFTQDGVAVRSALAPYPVHYFNGNWAEQDAMDWWRAFCQNNRAVLEGIDPAEVAAVSVSGQMMGCLPVDQNAVPLRPVIIWTDGRAVNETALLQSKVRLESFYNIVGIRPSPNFTIEKVMWLMSHEPQVYEKAYRFLSSKDFINVRLTGVFATDPSDAGYTHAYDFYGRCWSQIILDAAGADPEKFPQVLEAGTLLGGVLPSVAEEAGLAPGTPVVEGVGDGRSACLGTGVLEPGDAYICLGTSSWVSRVTRCPGVDPLCRIQKSAFQRDTYTDGGTMQAGGLSMNWLKNQLCLHEQALAGQQGGSAYDYINQAAKASSAGSGGVLFLPYLMGDRAPLWDMGAKGAFLGLKGETTRGDLLRSVMEGVAMNLTTILGIMRGISDDITSMRIVGGGSKSALWRQIFADCFNMPVVKTNISDEAGSLGTAVVAGTGVGVYDSFSVVKDFHRVESVSEPIPENVERYRRQQEIFESAYLALREINHRLGEL